MREMQDRSSNDATKLAQPVLIKSLEDKFYMSDNISSNLPTSPGGELKINGALLTQE